MRDIKEKVQQYIQEAETSGRAEHVSFYLRDLSNGPWVGIDEDEKYSPASLLKVPFMIAAFRQAQYYPDFLNQSLVYIPSNNEVKQNINTDYHLDPGQSVPVLELIQAMIIYSDNRAKNMLVNAISQQILDDVFSDLGMNITQYADGDNFISVKEYAGFFRILYNASLLNQQYCEMALEMLANTLFQKGLRAGVPAEVMVAHKFGERSYLGNDIKQLHDCGIVYKQGKPYLICVMTRGKDFDTQAKIIADISAITYQNF